MKIANGSDEAGNIPKKLYKNTKKSTGDIPIDVQQPLSSLPLEFLQQLDKKLTKTLKKELIREKQQKDNNADYVRLETITTEYLKSFMIIGFGLNGDKVFIGHANTAEQHDSLIEHLRQSFINIIGNIS